MATKQIDELIQQLPPDVQMQVRDSAYLSVPAAIQVQAAHDWPGVRARYHELLRELQ